MAIWHYIIIIIIIINCQKFNFFQVAQDIMLLSFSISDNLQCGMEGTKGVHIQMNYDPIYLVQYIYMFKLIPNEEMSIDTSLGYLLIFLLIWLVCEAPKILQ